MFRRNCYADVILHTTVRTIFDGILSLNRANWTRNIEGSFIGSFSNRPYSKGYSLSQHSWKR